VADVLGLPTVAVKADAQRHFAASERDGHGSLHGVSTFSSIRKGTISQGLTCVICCTQYEAES